jgi:hypothetical protein
MEYFVVGLDGQQYGPANLQTLEGWAAENRIMPTTILKDAVNGQTLPASSVLKAFMPQATAPPAAAMPPQGTTGGAPGAQSPYLRPNAPNPNWNAPPGQYQQQTRNDAADKALLTGVLIRCGLAIILAFVLRAAGLITAVYALIYAIQAKSRDHKHGTLLIVIAGITLAIVGAAFAYKMANPTVY